MLRKICFWLATPFRAWIKKTSKFWTLVKKKTKQFGLKPGFYSVSLPRLKSRGNSQIILRNVS